MSAERVLYAVVEDLKVVVAEGSLLASSATTGTLVLLESDGGEALEHRPVGPATFDDLAEAFAAFSRSPREAERLVFSLMDHGLVYPITGVLERPLIIISAPRAGSTLLFETLSQARDVWTIGGEGQSIVESISELRAAERGYESHRLTRHDADAERSSLLQSRFIAELRDRDGMRYLALQPRERPDRVRFLEKTPRNSLRVSFLNRVFPDALFVYLYRDARQNVASLMEAWMAPGFWQYKGDLPGWDREEWCMLLPPGWRDLRGKSLADVAAAQWDAANRFALDDLQQLPSDRWCTLDFADFLQNPHREVARLCDFGEIALDDRLVSRIRGPLPLSSSVVSPPRRDKWRSHEPAISQALERYEPTMSRIRSLRD